MEFDNDDVLRFDPLTAVLTHVRPSAVLRAGEPDQPRDDDGKWTDGGGGGGGGERERAPKTQRQRGTPAERKARTKEAGRDAVAAKREEKRAAQKIEKAEARLEKSIAKEAEIEREVEAKEMAAAEAGRAFEEAEGDLAALEDNDDATESQKQIARENVEKCRTEALAADRAREAAEDKSARAYWATVEREGDLLEAEEEHHETQAEAKRAEDWHAYHQADEHDDDDERAAVFEDHKTKADRELTQARAELDSAKKELAEAESDRDTVEAKRVEAKRADDEASEEGEKSIASSLEAKRAEKDGDKKRAEELRAKNEAHWARRTELIEKRDALEEEASDMSRRVERKISAATRASNAARARVDRSETSVEFWQDAASGDLEHDETEGTAEDRDGDGRTGTAEEQDDKT